MSCRAILFDLDGVLVDLGSDEAQRLGDAAPVRHPQEVRRIEPALGGPRGPNELDALARIDEYAIQIEQDSATRHGRNGMNLLGGRPLYGPFTGLYAGLYSPQTPRNTSETSPTVARARTASMIGSIRGAVPSRAAASRSFSARFTLPPSRFSRRFPSRFPCAFASDE